MRASRRWMITGTCLVTAMFMGSTFAAVSAQTDVADVDACVAEIEPNDDGTQAITFAGERCISGTLAEVGDTDVFLWDVDEEAAAASWSLTLQGVPQTVTMVELVQADPELGAQVTRLEVGPDTGPDLASANVTVDPGRYAFVVSRDDPTGEAELTDDRGYELRVTRAAADASATPVIETGTARIVVVTGDQGAPRVGSSVAIEMLLDTSGSMLRRLGKSTKIEVAEQTLIELVDELPRGIPVALRTFVAKPESCATNLRVPLEPLKPKAMKSAIRNLPSRKTAKSPIAKAIEMAPKDLRDAEGHRVVVLVTDGKEDCGGDPAAAIVALREAGYTSTVHLIGYALGEDQEVRDALAAWAALGGGRYLEAPDRASLAQAFETVTTAPYLVFDDEDMLVAQGLVGDEGVEIDAGVYRVEVLSDPPMTFDEVVLEAGATIDLPQAADAGTAE